MKEMWYKAWRAARLGGRLQPYGELAPLASHCLRVRKFHHLRLTPVEDYYHRRKLGQAPQQALAGARAHRLRAYSPPPLSHFFPATAARSR